MSEIKVNSIKGVGASAAAITVNNTDGTCTANITNNLSNRNKIINGGMTISQRATQETGLGASNKYSTLDRYRLEFNNTAGRLTMSQDTDSPDGFGNSLKLACTTADTSIAADEFFLLTQRIEGQNLQDFAKGTSSAKKFTVSFYVKGNASATYVFELYDQDNNRHVNKTFNVTSSWTRVTISYPADTTGAFGNDNQNSLSAYFWLHGGSNYTSGTLQQTWGTGTAANRAVGISSFFDSTARTLFITGLQLEVDNTGSGVATDFEHRSFGQELDLCRRYYYNLAFQNSSGTQSLFNGSGYDSSTIYHVCVLPTPMRAIPTIEQNTSGSYFQSYGNGGSNSYSTLIILNTASTSIVEIYNGGTHSRGGGVSHFTRLNSATTDGKFRLTAEL